MKHQAALKIAQPESQQAPTSAVEVSGFHVWHRDTHILNDIHVSFQYHRINCIIGPSGSGKSTLIRSINRINDEVEGFTFKGAIHLDGKNIYDKSVDATRLRTEVGMVFQKPCVFPKSICENVLFGIQHLRKLSRQEKLQIVEDNLRSVFLWKEVSHRLNDKASSLSIGQQQRLCIARTLAVKPKVILLDEPTSSLDPVSARAIEELMLELKKEYTIVLVTHNIQQAKRIADNLIFMCEGQIIEQGPKQKLFNKPEKKQTKQYLNEEYCEC
jgi:phosphate transport system ATP-binding protein